MPGDRLSRRRALGVAIAALLPAPLLAQQDTSEVLRLMDPFRAGRPRDRITDYENDPFIVGLEEQLRCTCGCNLSVYTCRTTDFTCTVSPAMHRDVVAMVEEQKTAQQILDSFVAQYGETVLMAPRKEGFNLAGYVVPGVAITLTGGVLAWALARRIRLAVPSSAEPSSELSSEDAARLEAELRQLER